MHQQISEVPKLPCGERAARAVQKRGLWPNGKGVSSICCLLLLLFAGAARERRERKNERGGAADGGAAASRDIMLGMAPGTGPMDKARPENFPCAGAVGCVVREGRSTDVLAAATVADADGSRSGAAGDGVERAGGCEGGAPRPATSSILTPRPSFFCTKCRY